MRTYYDVQDHRPNGKWYNNGERFEKLSEARQLMKKKQLANVPHREDIGAVGDMCLVSVNVKKSDLDLGYRIVKVEVTVVEEGPAQKGVPIKRARKQRKV